MQRTVLLIDNNLNVLDVYGRNLEAAGYHVAQAATIAEARILLETVAVDVLIVDVRMEDDKAAVDISGVVFVEEVARRFPELARIVLTIAENTPYPVMRRVSGAKLVGKLEGVETLLEAVRAVFQEQVALNWDLRLVWAHPESARQLALLLDPDLPSARLDGYADELHRLFATLFPHCAAVGVDRLVAQEPGRVTLAVKASAPGGMEEPCLIVCGHRDVIDAEQAQYEQHFLRRGGDGVPDRVGFAHRLHYGAIAYRLDASDPADLIPLRALVPVAGGALLTAVTSDLFERALRSWHMRNPSERDDADLTAFLRGRMNPRGYPPDTWRQLIEALCAGLTETGLAGATYARGQLTLAIDRIQVAFPDPVAGLFDGETFTLGGKTAWGFLHSALDLDRVLADRVGRVWLCDLRTLTEGPLLWDFARIETAVSLAGLASTSLGDADALCRLLIRDATDQDGEVDAASLAPALGWTFAWCSTIRDHADKAVDWGSYMVGLLASAAEQLGRFPLDGQAFLSRRMLLYYGHALIRVLRCLQVLDAARQRQRALPEASRRGLHLDEAGATFYVDSQPLNLSRIEFALVAYLYEHRYKVCSPKQIYQAVWHNAPELRDSRLTTTLERVREKMSAISHRGYIVTQRGFGYKLVPEGIEENDRKPREQL